MKVSRRIAMVITAYHPIVGGAERQLGNLAPRMMERGMDVHVITRRYAGLAAFELVDGVPVHRMPCPGPMPVASLIFTFSALWMLLKLRPDVIHAHELLSPTTTAVLANLLNKTPVVAKVLGGGMNGDISKLRRNPVSAIRVSTVLKKVSKFIAISREIESEIVSAGVPSRKIACIPNGVDLKHFRPISDQSRQALRKSLDLPSAFLAVYTGRLDEEKNVKTLVSIWPAVRKMHPGAVLAVVGTGSQDEEIGKLAVDGVLMLGSKKDVLPYLQAADAFILPSVREGLSNAILEAMACGLPVAANAVGGNLELVKPGETGLLCDVRNPASMVQAIVELAANESTRIRMGGMARRFVEENYSIDKTVDSLLGLYDELVTDPQPAAA